MKQRVLSAVGVLLCAGAAVAEGSCEPASDIGFGPIELRLIGEHRVPADADYHGTRIGGLSGIDFDPDWGYLVAISDDKGQYAAPRAYLGQIELADDRIVGLEWTNMLPITIGTGELIDVPLDPEGIRFIPHGDEFGEPTLLFVSEGDANRGVEPRLYEMCSGATRMDEWPAPKTHVAKSARSRSGVRHNRAFESVAVVGDRVAVVANEEPLRQDGDELVRLTTYDLHEPLAEPISEIAYPLGPAPDGLVVSSTGLVDLLALDGGRLLALERSFSPAGRFGARLYVVEPSGATDVLGAASLRSA
ncbi:MAG: esterase-like activity of phytase family protein, partial [Planctomycetota bacterium]